MLVLRFTSETPDGGERTEEIQTPRDEVLVGSDPTADITLQGMGLAPEAIRLRVETSRVSAEVLPADGRVGRRITLREGDEFQVGGVSVTLVSFPQGGEEAPAFIFGGYEDDPVLPKSTTFELASPGGATKPPPGPTTTEPFGGSPGAPSPGTGHAGGGVPRADEARQPSARKKVSSVAAAAASAAVTSAAADHSGQRARDARSATAPPSRRKSAASRPPPKPPKLTAAQKAALLQPVKFQDPSFGEALFQQLKRAPFFAVSTGLHLLLFLVLMLLDTTAEQEVLPIGPGAIMASMEADEVELAVEVPELKDELGLPQLPSEMPDLPEEIDVEPVPEKEPPPTPSPFREDIRVLEERDQESVDIGLMPGLVAASNNRIRRRPRMPKVNLKQTFTKGAAGSSNKTSAELVRAQLGRGRKGDKASLDDLKPEDILVVSGTFDHIHRVLDMLRIRYVKKSPWALFQPKIENFSTYKAVFWNCGESMGEQRTKSICKGLQKFVRNGGYLFTTDWGVATVLQFAFPGYLRTTGNRAHLPEMVLPIEANRSARNHPLLEGVFHHSAQGKWWLEQASFDVSVGRKDAVTVLIDSPMLKSTLNRSPVVAATFTYGRGRVLHTMGHYYQEAGNLAGTLSAHRLALNFVLMRLDQDRAARGGR